MTAEPGGVAAGRKPGSLYVVATPIGNLGDVTLRALEVLRSVAVIAAEDTRLTRRLLDRYEIEARTISYHARSGPGRERELLEHLRAGADVALVTDAGTPVISDPGEGVIAAWTAEGGRVIPIPGASSVLAAVSATGLAGPRWSFEGFLPRSGRERRERLARLAGDERGAVLFEAPNRVAGTLRDLAAACGPDRRAAVCRELTKLHESILTGTLAELLAALDDARIPARGEFVVVLGMAATATDGATGDAGAAPSLEEARVAVERLVAAGVARGEAARRVAAESGIPRRALYGAARDEG